MTTTKVVVLGGSGLATPALAEAIASWPNRRVPIELALVGRDSAKLAVVAGIARLMAGADPLLTITAHTAVEAALEGAQYVVNQVRVGGLPARVFDESFPQALGLPGEETVGPGGFANASRTIPVVLESARLVERIAPQALLINFANPASLVQYAITRCTSLHTLGLCDGPVTLAARIARAVNHPPTDLRCDYVGMHHFGWVTGVWHGERDLLPDALANAAVAAPDVEPAIVQAINAIPGLYLNYIFHPDRILARQMGRRTRAEELLALQDEMAADYAQSLAAGIRPASLARRGARWYQAIIAPALMALIENTPARLVVNFVNRATIPWLPGEAIIEAPAMLAQGRVEPLAVGPAPRVVKALLAQNCAYEMLAVEAIMAHNRAQAIAALLVNPMIHTFDQAQGTVERAWAAA